MEQDQKDRRAPAGYGVQAQLPVFPHAPCKGLLCPALKNYFPRLFLPPSSGLL